jgi:hypothetical protein
MSGENTLSCFDSILRKKDSSDGGPNRKLTVLLHGKPGRLSMSGQLNVMHSFHD